MNLLKKILVMLLVLALCLGVLAGCGEKKDPNNNKPNDDSSESQDGDEDEDESDDESDDETEDPKATDELDEAYNFDKEFKILSRGSTKYEFESESNLTGSDVENAIYERNEYVMERCGVEITVLEQPGDWGNLETFTSLLRSNASEATSEYDLVGTHSAYLMTAALEGLAADFNSLPGINLEKRWWSESYYDSVNYNGAIYMMYGDIAYTMYEYLQVCFFNEQMAEDLGIEDLYDLAIDGDWTFAKLKEYTELVTSDPNLGDQGTYGFLTNSHSQRAFPAALGCDLTVYNDQTGKHEIPMFLGLQTQTRLQDFIDFVVENEHVYSVNADDTGDYALTPIFSSGRALFYTQTLGEAIELKAIMDDNYGVLPFPKWDDNQINYVTGIRDTVTGIIVPRNAGDKTMCGVVTEMLCMESYRTVTNEYYEEALKYQSFNNPDCVESLAIIRDSFSPSFAQVYSHYLGFINSTVSGNIRGNATGTKVGIATYYAQSSIKYGNLLKDLYTALDGMATAE